MGLSFVKKTAVNKILVYGMGTIVLLKGVTGNVWKLNRI